MNQEKIISFMRYRKLAASLSIALLLISVISLSVNGLRLGLDFTGGTLVELSYGQPANLNDIRESLKEKEFPNAVVVNFGTEKDVLIRMQRPDIDDPKLGDKVFKHLQDTSNDTLTLKRIEYVGPQIGEELRDEGGLGLLFALAVVMIYVAMRFQFKFSVGAVAALGHDVIIVLGIFSLLQLEFDLTVLAALLAVIGYSLNDTIVVADRIRENFRKIRDTSSIDVVDISLTQTLGRTLITSLTTLLVLVALFVVGGELIHNFSIALIIGILVGTYSSVYVASNILLLMNITAQDLMEPEKEGEEFEDIA